jgi:hypothetical protein
MTLLIGLSLENEQAFVGRDNISLLKTVVIENPLRRHAFLVGGRGSIKRWTPPMLDRELLGAAPRLCDPLAPLVSAHIDGRVIFRRGVTHCVLGKGTYRKRLQEA